MKQLYLDSKKAAVSKKIQVKYLVLTIFQEIIDNVAKGAKKKSLKMEEFLSRDHFCYKISI